MDILEVKVGAHVMILHNIDVHGGLTNGTKGTVSSVVTKWNKEEISPYVYKILVKFNTNEVGLNAKESSKYKDIDQVWIL